jgi:hypothetical protein
MSKSIQRRLALQAEGKVSPCCHAAVYVAGEGSGEGSTHWYECSACGEPCDPIRDLPDAD